MLHKRSLVTIIIPNWNGKQHLDSCLSSLRQQIYRDFNVIIVDNGSIDGSVEYIKRNYQEVRIIALPENRGFCASNNLAIRKSDSKYVCLLNNDTELDPECLGLLVQALENHPHLGICDAKQLFFDHRNIIYSAGADYTVAGSVMGRGYLEESENLEETTYSFVGMAACVLYRRSMLREIGLLDEDFFAGYEDLDLSFRAHLAGWGVQNVGKARCYHKISATHRRDSFDYVRRGQRNLHWAYLKNMPSLLLRRYWIFHLLYTFITGLYFFRIGRGNAWLLAKYDVLRSIPRLVDKRRRIQSLLKVSANEIDRLLKKDWLSGKDKREKMLSAWRIKKAKNIQSC